jgi:hypothetical protein
VQQELAYTSQGDWHIIYPEIAVDSGVRQITRGSVLSVSRIFAVIKREGYRYGPSHAPLRVSDVFQKAFAELRPRIH